MTLIKSISGIRGTIGGSLQEGLNPVSTALFTSAYAQMIRSRVQEGRRPRIVVGRDARISGLMVKNIVVGTLMGMGCDVVDIDLATTPTTEMAVVHYGADGGIILTASHNPRQWNALKLLNADGEFLNAEEGAEILRLAESDELRFACVDSLGGVDASLQTEGQPSYTRAEEALEHHIRAILEHPAVDVEAIRAAGFSVAFDAVNSVGGVALPALFRALGVQKVDALYDTPNGQFPHNPEPLPEHLGDICERVRRGGIDVAFVVDPDVDRLAIIDERGELIGEEYTLVAVADYLLGLNGGGNTVSNLSSTRALRDVTLQHGGAYSASAVGEVNVVAKMKETDAVIGGEGNGGVIVPELHYGRDALAGIALFLSYLAKSGKTVSQLRAGYPNYYMSKQKVELAEGTDSQAILDKLAEVQKSVGEVNLVDGVKIEFSDRWVHVRRSNTEPIIRIYTEASSQASAHELADLYRALILSLL